MQIVGLGLATLDVLLRLKDMPTWENPGALGDFGFDGGGPVGTACVAAARLGARVGYVGTAGNDQIAELKMQSLSENGVDVSHVVRRDEPETQLVMVYVHEETGERVFGGARRHTPRNEPLRVDELDRDYITSAQYLHLDGTHFEAAMQAIEWMHAAGKEVCIDCAKTDGRPVRQHLADLVPHVDILICGSGFGYSLTGHEDIWKAGEAMLAMGPRIVVQTEGRDGSYTTTADERFQTPIIDLPVIDTTGAGDVFHGAYLVGLSHGWDLRTVAWFSTAVSAIKCTKLGGRRGIPCYDDVMALLREQGIEVSI